MPGTGPTRVLVAGGGYVGMYAALRLLHRLPATRVRLTVVDPHSYMTYQPFLPEAGAGSIQPRHTVVPLRRTLRGAEVVTAWVTQVDHGARTATLTPLEGEPYQRRYDVLVMAVGSVPRTLAIPGLADWAMGFSNVEEAIALRNRVLECLDIADGATDPEIRERNLTFVFVGGGYAGVEAMAEAEDLARYATRFLHNVTPGDLHFVLVEAADHILPEMGPAMGDWTVAQLRSRGIDVRLRTQLASCVGGHVQLSDGAAMLSDTVVWTAGVKPNPVLAQTDLPLDERGRVRCRPDLRVVGLADAWAAGDNAAVPDVDNPGSCFPPTAQNAVRQGRLIGDNLAGWLDGWWPRPYRHKNLGSVASLGLYKGVAQVGGVRLKGFPAWFLHRTYHLGKVPTLRRKVEVATDWTVAFLFARDVTSLWNTHDPDRSFQLVARGEPPGRQGAAKR